MGKFRLIGIFAFLLPIITLGDSWFFDGTRSEKEYIFGQTRMLRIIDSTKESQYPDYVIVVFNGNKLVARYPGVSFQNIYASNDNEIFIGLSNSGLPGTAIIIFDKDGKLKLELKHHFGKFRYCQKSVTVFREWYSPDQTNFHFVYNESREVIDARLNDCKGIEVSLDDVIDYAYNKVNSTDAPKARRAD